MTRSGYILPCTFHSLPRRSLPYSLPNSRHDQGQGSRGHPQGRLSHHLRRRASRLDRWEPVGNEFTFAGPVGTHQFYDATQHPWKFKRVWHLEPHPTEPDTVYAGVEDAALFRSTDGGASWEVATGGLSSNFLPDGEATVGHCVHNLAMHPSRPDTVFMQKH